MLPPEPSTDRRQTMVAVTTQHNDLGRTGANLILLANSRDQVAMSRANFEWRVLELGVSVSQASMR